MGKYVICLSNEGYAASLEVRKLYELLPDPKAEAMHCIRIVDEDGEDYVYPENSSCRWKCPNRYPSHCINKRLEFIAKLPPLIFKK